MLVCLFASLLLLLLFILTSMTRRSVTIQPNMNDERVDAARTDSWIPEPAEERADFGGCESGKGRENVM